MPRHYRSYRARNRGLEAALEHIKEAKEFTEEIGGTDQDVKKYFFNLSEDQLEAILEEYGRQYGRSKMEYAYEAYPYWKNGQRKMSGLVAKRLFSLLPPKMPVRKKYELAENVWKHFGPKSSINIIAGPNANVNELAEFIKTKLDEMVDSYYIPDNVRNRFNWLAQGDVTVKEELLNYFREQQKNLSVEKLQQEAPVLQKQVREHGNITGKAKTVLQIDKHEINIWIDAKLDENFREGRPENVEMDTGNLKVILFWVGIAIVLIYFLL